MQATHRLKNELQHHVLITNVPVLTIELEHAGIMPSPIEVNDIWIDMIRWLRQNSPGERPGEPMDLEEKLRLAQGKEIKIDEIDEIENIFYCRNLLDTSCILTHKEVNRGSW